MHNHRWTCPGSFNWKTSRGKNIRWSWWYIRRSCNTPWTIASKNCYKFDRYRREASLLSRSKIHPIRRAIKGRRVSLLHFWANFLSNELIHRASSKTLVVVTGDAVFQQFFNGLPSPHEEADIRVVLHAVYSQTDNVIVYATLGDLGDTFAEAVIHLGQSHQRIVIIFDRYRRESSLLSTSKINPIRRAIEGRRVSLLHNWANFLSNELIYRASNKTLVVVTGRFSEEMQCPNSFSMVYLHLTRRPTAGWSCMQCFLRQTMSLYMPDTLMCYWYCLHTHLKQHAQTSGWWGVLLKKKMYHYQGCSGQSTLWLSE